MRKTFDHLVVGHLTPPSRRTRQGATPSRANMLRRIDEALIRLEASADRQDVAITDLERRLLPILDDEDLA